jgi:hypothetical protein
MEKEAKVCDLKTLLEWIENEGSCYMTDIYEDNFIIQAPNNATWQIIFEKDESIDAI